MRKTEKDDIKCERKKDFKDERLKGREKRMRIRYRKQTIWRMREEKRVRVEYERSGSARLEKTWKDKKNEGK